MNRTFLTTKAGATFHETSPQMTVVVRKETIELIYKMDRGRYAVVHLFPSAPGRVVLLAHWGPYFQRLSNPAVQLPQIRKNCPTLYAVLAGEDPDGVERLSVEDFVDGLGLEVEVDSQVPVWACLTPSLLRQLEGLITKNMRIYNELMKQPPFPAWKDGLKDVWNG